MTETAKAYSKEEALKIANCLDRWADHDAPRVAATLREYARLKEREERIAHLLAYLRDHEVFEGAAPNSCGGCRHPDCLSNEQEWSDMRDLVAALTSTETGDPK